jgi:hypothetical protein
MKLNPHITPYNKSVQNVLNLNVRPKTEKLIEYNIEKKL